jgi:hypothetical protein
MRALCLRCGAETPREECVCDRMGARPSRLEERVALACALGGGRISRRDLERAVRLTDPQGAA